MEIVFAAKDPSVPEWLRSNINNTCPYCGYVIVTERINGRLTQRYCGSPTCPAHAANKLVDAANYLGYKGIGFQTAYSLVKNELNHMRALNKYTGQKPIVELWEAMLLINIYGHHDDLKDVCLGKSSLAELVDSEDCPQWVQDNKSTILSFEDCFTIKPSKQREVLYVMLTGSMVGYANREDYLKELNDILQDFIVIYSCGKSPKASALIKESHTSDHSKSAYAKEHHLPILTPKEFNNLLARHCSNILKGGVDIEDWLQRVPE